METIMATTTENNTATDTNFDDKRLPFPYAELEVVEKALELLQKAFEKFPDDFWQASECWRTVEKVLSDFGQDMWEAMHNLWTEKRKTFDIGESNTRLLLVGG
jgi:hypothetical protein